MSRLETASLLAIFALACTLGASPATAQQSSAAAPAASPSAQREMPTPEQLEPGVNTSPSGTDAPSDSGAAPAASDRGGAETHAAAAPSSSPGGAASAGRKRQSSTVSEKAGAEGAKQSPAASSAHKGPDRLQLDATDITGNRELPKVLYIVPWKRSDLGDLTGRPVNSLLDEVLQPLDRDVFQRENRYYNGLKPPAAGSKGDAPSSPGSKP